METKQLVLFGALAFIGFLLYQEWQKDYGMAGQLAATSSSTFATPDSNTDLNSPVASNPASSAEGLPSATASSVKPTSMSAGNTAAGQSNAQYTTIITDKVQAKVSTRGASITDLQLLGYPKVKKRPDDLVQLLNHGEQFYFVAQGGIVFGGRAREDNPNHAANFTLVNSTDTSLTYRWESEGVSVDKTIQFNPGSYEIDVSYNVSNTGEKPVNAQAYGQLVRSGMTDVPPPPFVQSYLSGAIYELEGENYKFEKTKLDKFRKKPVSLEQTGGWISMIQHHFMGAIIPPADKELKINSFVLKRGTETEDDDRLAIRYLTANPETVAPGQTVTFSDRLFIGPKLRKDLKELAPGLPLAVDYGMLTAIAEPLFWVLRKLHDLTGNWGIAIILLTLLVKILFYKPSEWQYRSMAKMRKFAPKIKALKERYGDDREKLNAAMMKLYKDEKFNPFGGCLPMLIQMPVFIALYWVLIESVELRQAPFLFWLNDLTSPDPLYILPLIFAASMFVQQRLMAQSGTMDPMQEKVMMFMPIGMGIFFAFFPSGLVLYWVANNLLSIAQQWYITRKVEQEDAVKA